jgi:hypothetical protein
MQHMDGGRVMSYTQEELDSFLQNVRALDLQWQMYYGRVRCGENAEMCPVSALVGKDATAVWEVGPAQGLSLGLVRAVARAADNDGDPEVRRQLLLTCGLSAYDPSTSPYAKVFTRTQYKNYVWCIREVEGGHLVWARFAVGEATMTTRKWYVSRHTTDSELTQTLLKCVLTSEEHEAREQFLVDGVAAFGPHIATRELVKVARTLDARRDAGLD